MRDQRYLFFQSQLEYQVDCVTSDYSKCFLNNVCYTIFSTPKNQLIIDILLMMAVTTFRFGNIERFDAFTEHL